MSLFLRGVRKLFRIIGVPSYRVKRMGRLIAFVGVDGAGKSSLIEKIENMPYFKALSVKTMYFGNNQYWIPGLNLVAKKIYNKKITRLISIFTRIDRQLRILFAFYYMMLGRDVLADRYYYDDLYTRSIHAIKQESGFKKWFHKNLRNITSVRMLYVPDITIFLNVSPEVSYSRKQDHSYDKLVNTIAGYRKLLKSREEVLIIDADKSIEQVLRTVLLAIVKTNSGL